MIQCDIDSLVKSSIKQPCEVDYPFHAVYVFAKTVNASRHNNQMLQSISDDLHTITSINPFPVTVSNQKIN